MFPSLHTKDERHVKCKAWNVKRRAPQGSVLHLMLFNILIDDLSYFPRQKGLAECLCGWSSAGIQPSHVDPVALEACVCYNVGEWPKSGTISENEGCYRWWQHAPGSSPQWRIMVFLPSKGHVRDFGIDWNKYILRHTNSRHTSNVCKMISNQFCCYVPLQFRQQFFLYSTQNHFT